MVSNREQLKNLKAKLDDLYIEQNAVEESLNKLDTKERKFGWYAQSIYGGGILVGIFSAIASFLTSGLSLIVTGGITLICGGIRFYQNILYKRVRALEIQLEDLKKQNMYTNYQFKKLLSTERHVSYKLEKYDVIHHVNLKPLKAAMGKSDDLSK